MHPEDTTYFDANFGVGYAKVSGGEVARTLEYSESIVLDMDSSDRLVGIEVLGRVPSLPVQEMAQKFSWGPSTVARAAEAARRLRSLMDASSSVSGDGVINQVNGWSNPGLVTT
ncbi:DUF2283 domain-containing protein [Nesterenkonia lacusekhoensis]|uniref:DUF2283 domain-containing protein n=1 Tax=Nesterenkonia lacusekhoensis TaxID=150832 RepID=UPI001AE59E6D